MQQRFTEEAQLKGPYVSFLCLIKCALEPILGHVREWPFYPFPVAHGAGGVTAIGQFNAYHLRATQSGTEGPPVVEAGN